MFSSTSHSVRALAALDFICRWANDNPGMGAADLFGLLESNGCCSVRKPSLGFTVTGSHPKMGIKHRALPGGSFGVGLDIPSHRLTASNVPEGVVQFDAYESTDFLNENLEKAQGFAAGSALPLGLKSFPFTFSDPSFYANHLYRPTTRMSQFSWFLALVPVAGFPVPYFLGERVGGRLWKTEPRTAFFRTGKISGKPSVSKFVPNSKWTDLAAVLEGFQPDTHVPGLTGAGRTPFEPSTYLAASRLELLEGGGEGDMDYRCPAGQTRMQLGMGFGNDDGGCGGRMVSVPKEVLMEVLRSVLDWARGLRRSCDAPLGPGFTVNCPVSVTAELVENGWDVPANGSPTSLGMSNHDAVVALLRLAATSKTPGSYGSLQDPYDNQGALSVITARAKAIGMFDEIPAEVVDRSLSDCSAAIVPLGTAATADFPENRYRCEVGTDGIVTQRSVEKFNEFYGEVVERDKASIGSNRKKFNFLLPHVPGRAVPPNPWTKGHADTFEFAIHSIESALSRYAEYGN